MAAWEKRLFDRCLIRPVFYKRYIDDIFLIWPGTLESLEAFIALCNSLSPGIKVISECSSTEVHFLDILLFKGQRFLSQGILDFRVAFKDTDSHRIVSRSSFHPPHVKRSVIWSQVLRLARRCNDKAFFDEACRICFSVWVKQGYTYRHLRTTKYKVLAAIGFYRRGRRWPDGFVRCHRSVCRYCDSLCIFTSSVANQNDSVRFRVLSHITCSSKHVVYGVFCVKCDKFVYVGETSLPLSVRMTNHLSTIRCRRDVPVATHFSALDHSISEIRFVGLQSLEHLRLGSEEITQRRRLAETVWIRRLGTLAPVGLNIKRNLTRSNRVPFVVTYAPQIASFINNLKPYVQNSFGLTLLPSFRNSRNLKKILCPSRLPQS